MCAVCAECTGSCACYAPSRRGLEPAAPSIRPADLTAGLAVQKEKWQAPNHAGLYRYKNYGSMHLFIPSLQSPTTKWNDKVPTHPCSKVFQAFAFAHKLNSDSRTIAGESCDKMSGMLFCQRRLGCRKAYGAILARVVQQAMFVQVCNGEEDCDARLVCVCACCFGGLPRMSQVRMAKECPSGGSKCGCVWVQVRLISAFSLAPVTFLVRSTAFGAGPSCLSVQDMRNKRLLVYVYRVLRSEGT